MSSLIPRRSFIGGASLAGAALVTSPTFAALTPGAGKKLKVGLIGCGGRGRGALKDFTEAAKILGFEV